VTNELTRSLLLEEAAAPRAVGEALARSVNERVPLVTALLDARAASGEVMARHLARGAAPFLRQIAPALDVVDRLPPGLCERLLAVPVCADAITGTVDVVVADPADPHPAEEIAFHLGAPVCLLRAPLAAVQDALQRLQRLRAAPAPRPPTEPPKSGYGSEIPIPLTRKTASPLASLEAAQPLIPGPPALPGTRADVTPDEGSILAALRTAASRDDVLDLLLEGARLIAPKVALFVVKKGAYVGWTGAPEIGGRSTLKDVVVPLDADSVFDRAVREELYVGALPDDEVHAPLLRALGSATREVAVVPVRVAGRTGVVIVGDELTDTTLGARRLEELARAAGDALARIVRARR
jgi:hypothetical protein